MTTAEKQGGADGVGTLLAGRYRLESVIGRGGMSIVYRAEDTSLGRTVAIKRFSIDLADADDLRRQQSEIQLVASLNHPALVTLFDAVSDEKGRGALVMEYVPGTDLRRHLRGGAIGPDATARIGADLARALAYVHGRGIVHRDIKPANVLVPEPVAGAALHAKLADFGIARIVDAARLTGTGSLIGTAGYLSPEQALGATVGPTSDVYSLGLVLLECLTGTQEFAGSALESAAARLTRDPEVPARLGDEWGDLIRRMTRREPTERLRAAEVVDRLQVLAPMTTADDAPVGRTAAIPAATPGVDGSALLPDPVHAAAPVLTDFEETPTELSDPVDRPAASGDRALDPPTAVLAASDLPTVALDRPFSAPSGDPSRPLVDAATPAHSRRRRVAVMTMLVAVAVLLGVVIVPVIGSAVPTAPAPSKVEYPVVEGDLGAHLEELQRSVEP